MHFQFTVAYVSKPDETVFVNLYLNKDELLLSFPLQYKDENIWEKDIYLNNDSILKKISYQIAVRNEFSSVPINYLYKGSVNLKKIKYNKIEIIHRQKRADIFLNVKKSKSFKKVFNPFPDRVSKKCECKNATHIFKISHPLLQDNIFICLTGSAKKLHLFNNDKPVLFPKNKANKSVLKFNFSKEKFPIEYKIAFYDTQKKCIVEYEPGANQVIEKPADSKNVRIINAEPDCKNYLWKGAGINIPMFSLRTQNTWGCGDFGALKLMVDYACTLGIKMIQLLPVNDTVSSFTDKDSYPYAAISSFALHPLYLNVAQILEENNITLLDSDRLVIDRLNKLSYCEYSQIITLKLSVVKRILSEIGVDFLRDKKWHLFYEKNYEWLIPYAAFCVLRDKHKSVNTADWGEYALYDIEKILSFAEPENDHHQEILYWYFIQFQLHLQLKDASEYAHKNKIILKADLPIGIAKHSVDAWVNPELFNMNMQAGAPPDAFSAIGQNWHFPTYNIKKMRDDDFAWFIKRMKSLENYFDALRIDHVLGLFRIWSIPQNQVDGSMGIFVPAIPITKFNFIDEGFSFDEERLCYPFITEDLLNKYFGDDVDAIKTVFFDGSALKEEYNDQQKLAAYLNNDPTFFKYKQQLFNIVSNVILLKDAENNDAYHFRINMQQTNSFQQLADEQKNILNTLYNQYFFENQNELWQKEGTATLSTLAHSSKMLLCAEDLGMVPSFTEKVLADLNILSLQIQQMPKTSKEHFSDTRNAKYPCVVMPATHDMPPIRLWWEQNKTSAQLIFNTILKEPSNAPYFCEPFVCQKIIELHLQSPAMWSVFLLQDLLAMDGKIRRPIPAEERINDPANTNQVWNYRMHKTIEELMQADEMNQQLKHMIKESGR